VGWRVDVLKKQVNLPKFSKLFEIVREKAKFSQTSVEINRNFPKRGVKFVEINRNCSDGTDGANVFP